MTRTFWKLALSLSLGATLAGAPGHGQTPARKAPDAAQSQAQADDLRRSTQAEFDKLQAEIRLTDERLTALKAETAALEQDRARIAEQLIAAGERARTLELNATTAEQAIQTLETQAQVLKASLAARRVVLAEVLAGLQRMGRNPPPAVLVKPEDALGAVRSAILMGAVLPELRDQALKLSDDLNAMVTLRERSARERDSYRADLTALAEERARLEILVEERRRLKSDQQKVLDEERRKAQELASRATSLKELITKSETDLEGARKGVAAAEEARRKAEEAQKLALNVPPPKAEDKPATAPPKQNASLGPATARMEPSRPFTEGRGQLAVPAIGTVLHQFGEDDGSGLNLKGMQFVTRPRAGVTSPADGWVVYAGAFRSYGKVLIVNGGGGYHMVLAGMDRIDVEIGQFVLAGEPVGEMGDRRAPSVPNTDTKTGQPVLYVEFRKDGTPIDPGPWWAQTRDEKVRG